MRRELDGLREGVLRRVEDADSFHSNLREKSLVLERSPFDAVQLFCFRL